MITKIISRSPGLGFDFKPSCPFHERNLSVLSCCSSSSFSRCKYFLYEQFFTTESYHDSSYIVCKHPRVNLQLELPF